MKFNPITIFFLDGVSIKYFFDSQVTGDMMLRWHCCDLVTDRDTLGWTWTSMSMNRQSCYISHSHSLSLVYSLNAAISLCFFSSLLCFPMCCKGAPLKKEQRKRDFL